MAKRDSIMPKVKIENLHEGMVVAKEVKNMEDMLLLPVGCELRPKHIEILQSWGITDVEVEACEGTEEPKDPILLLPPKVAARLEAELRSRFWNFDASNPVQMEVFRLALKRKVLLYKKR